MPAPVTNLDASPRLLVVVAHPDDETFGCGSLLLYAASHGAVTAVCCATRGEAGEPAPDSGLAASELASVRSAELRAAAAGLGVSRVDLLDFVDSGMTGDASPETLVGAPFDAVRDAVRSCIDDFRPDVIVTLDASDGHRDHARIRDATIAAAELASWRVTRLYLQCLSQRLMQQWLQHVAAAAPHSGHLEVDVPGTPDEQITTVIDTSAHLAARERAIATHRSQLSPYQALPRDLQRAFLTVDRLQRVLPPWTGGPVETGIFPVPAGRLGSARPANS